ncbi:MAG: hypothetical protein M1837_000781 [Sclerophora amabilis]|nr:MAG: hypothetical protein M1837_000781 [Sclerophora amabilis]
MDSFVQYVDGYRDSLADENGQHFGNFQDPFNLQFPGPMTDPYSFQFAADYPLPVSYLVPCGIPVPINASNQFFPSPFSCGITNVQDSFGPVTQDYVNVDDNVPNSENNGTSYAPPYEPSLSLTPNVASTDSNASFTANDETTLYRELTSPDQSPQPSPIAFDIIDAWNSQDDNKLLSMYNQGKCAMEIHHSRVFPDRTYLNIETRLRVIRVRQGLPANQPRWTDEEAAIVRRMYDQGKKPAEIDASGELPHRNYHSIAGFLSRWMKKCGKKPGGPSTSSSSSSGSANGQRGPQQPPRPRPRRWTPEELRILRHAKENGLDAKAIHRSHNLQDRSWRAITLELHRLGTLGIKKCRWTPDEVDAIRDAKHRGMSAQDVYHSQEVKNRSLRAITYQFKKIDEGTHAHVTGGEDQKEEEARIEIARPSEGRKTD